MKRLNRQTILSALTTLLICFSFLYVTSPFLTSRAKTFYTAVKTILSPHTSAAYESNNRYFPVVKLLQIHPNDRLIYIYDKSDSSWFHIQLVYEAYPKIPEDVLYSDILEKKFDLRTLPIGTVIASLHDIPELKNRADKQFYSKEYYLYSIK